MPPLFRVPDYSERCQESGLKFGLCRVQTRNNHGSQGKGDGSPGHSDLSETIQQLVVSLV
jgi:hypothetical protein